MVAYRWLRLSTLALLVAATWSLAPSRGTAGDSPDVPLADVVAPGIVTQIRCERADARQTGPIQCRLSIGPQREVSAGLELVWLTLPDDPRLRMLTRGDRVRVHVTVDRLSEPDQAGGRTQ